MNRRVFSRGSIALPDALRLVAAHTAAQIKTERMSACGRRGGTAHGLQGDKIDAIDYEGDSVLHHVRRVDLSK